MVKIIGVYKDRLTQADFGLTADVACAAGVFTPVGRYQIPFKQRVAWGTGAIMSGVDDRGQLAFLLQSAPATPIAGSIQIKYQDANSYRSPTVNTFRTTQATVAAPYRQENVANSLGVAQENSFLRVDFAPDAGATVTTADSTFEVDVTRYIIE